MPDYELLKYTLLECARAEQSRDALYFEDQYVFMLHLYFILYYAAQVP